MRFQSNQRIKIPLLWTYSCIRAFKSSNVILLFFRALIIIYYLFLKGSKLNQNFKNCWVWISIALFQLAYQYLFTLWCTFWMPPNKQINTCLTIKQPHHYWPIERCLNWTSNHIPLNTPKQCHSFMCSRSHYVLSFSCLSLKSNLWEQFIKLHCLMSINCSGL